MLGNVLSSSMRVGHWLLCMSCVVRHWCCCCVDFVNLYRTVFPCISLYFPVFLRISPKDFIERDQTCRAIFNAFHLLCSLFPIFATFIAYHDDFTILFSTMCTDNACFNNFVKSCELMLGESTLSLVIKPVQYLVIRYDRVSDLNAIGTVLFDS